MQADSQKHLFEEIRADLINSGALHAESENLVVYPEKHDEIPAKFLAAGVSEQALAVSFSRVMGWPVYDLEKYGVAEKEAKDGTWLWAGGVLFVTSPFNIPPARVILDPADLANLSYGILPWLSKTTAEDGQVEERAAEEAITEARRKIETWLHEAFRAGATDLHLVPANSREIAILHRVDSRLHFEKMWNATESLRYEYICNVLLGMANKQSGIFGRLTDGRVHTVIGRRGVELRLSMRPAALPDGPPLPAVFLRLPGRAGKRAMSLEELDVLPEQMAKLKRMAGCSSGISIFTGQTGSGKTTTLYALLSEMKSKFPHRSIQTLEDPVEQNIPGIVQTQINESGEMGFPAGLRSLMRTDVDTILLGEVRDGVTARQCISACLTGHYLLTTLHAPSAIGAVDRLLDLGVDLRLLASWLQYVSAQRLVRRVCRHCSTEVLFKDFYTAQKNSIFSDQAKARVANLKGCGKCNDGYQGLVLLLEVIEISEGLRELIRQGATAHELEKRAYEEGNLLLRGYAEQVVRDGKTTIEAVEEGAGFSLAERKENRLNPINQNQTEGGRRRCKRNTASAEAASAALH